MCGIIAIYAFDTNAIGVDPQELRTIRDHMTARGPDGMGEWYSNDQRLGLGHRRLAIIDPDRRSAQPMLSTDGRYAIVFNGEIYNFRELRSQLMDNGHRFHTESDTEVLLQLFAAQGENMLHRLRGMFALVIWDLRKKRLFLARDHYGIKPLYYAEDGKTIRVASQVKALLAGGRISRQQDAAGVAGFYLFGSVPEPFTVYRDVRQLPAGHFMWVDASGVSTPQLWFSIAETYLAVEKSQGSGSTDTQQSVRQALLDSVRYHLVSDVPVGAFLSAGIDSGTLVGLMRDAGAHDIQTITLGFKEFVDTKAEEVSLAEQVAQHYGTRHVSRIVDFQEFEADLPKILEAMDQPSIDGINIWFVSKAAKELGLKVAISGIGGDELFGGYPSFRDIPRWVRAFQWPGKIPHFGRLVRNIVSPLTSNLKISPKAVGLVEYGGSWEGAWLLRRGLFMPWELPALMGEDTAREGLQKLNARSLIRNAITPRPESAFARVACMEASLYMRNQLLRDADWAGMAHSLEIRVPLVDSVLLKALVRLQNAAETVDKLSLAKAPGNPLPDAIVQRKKTGFETPLSRWQAKLQDRVGDSEKGLRPWLQLVMADWDGQSGRCKSPESIKFV